MFKLSNFLLIKSPDSFPSALMFLKSVFHRQSVIKSTGRQAIVWQRQAKSHYQPAWEQNLLRWIGGTWNGYRIFSICQHSLSLSSLGFLESWFPVRSGVLVSAPSNKTVGSGGGEACRQCGCASSTPRVRREPQKGGSKSW